MTMFCRLDPDNIVDLIGDDVEMEQAEAMVKRVLEEASCDPSRTSLPEAAVLLEENRELFRWTQADRQALIAKSER